MSTAETTLAHAARLMDCAPGDLPGAIEQFLEDFGETKVDLCFSRIAEDEARTQHEILVGIQAEIRKILIRCLGEDPPPETATVTLAREVERQLSGGVSTLEGGG